MINAIEAIKTVIGRHGFGAFDNPERFRALLIDYAHGSNDYDMQVLRTCCERGILEFAKNVLLSEERNVLDLAYKEKLRLVELKYTSEKCATRGINIIIESLGKPMRLPENTDVLNELTQIESTLARFSSSYAQADYSEAWMKHTEVIKTNVQAARNRDASAMIFLGDLFSTGTILGNYKPLSKNLDLAIACYKDAIKLGNGSIKVEAEHKYTQLVLQLKG